MKEPTDEEIARGWTAETDAMVNDIILNETDLRSEAVLTALAAAGLLKKLKKARV